MQQPQRRSRAFADFLPRSPEDLPRVYAWFEQMRSNQPVFRAEQMPIWQVFRYEDVQEVITDHHRFSSEATFGDSFLANTLVTTDPPDHRTLRNLVNQAFTPRAVTRLSHRVTQITQQLLDAVKATGHMDVGPTPKHLTLTPGALVCGLSMLANPTAVSTSSVVE